MINRLIDRRSALALQFLGENFSLHHLHGYISLINAKFAHELHQPISIETMWKKTRICELLCIWLAATVVWGACTSGEEKIDQSEMQSFESFLRQIVILFPSLLEKCGHGHCNVCGLSRIAWYAIIIWHWR